MSHGRQFLWVFLAAAVVCGGLVTLGLLWLEDRPETIKAGAKLIEDSPEVERMILQQDALEQQQATELTDYTKATTPLLKDVGNNKNRLDLLRLTEQIRRQQEKFIPVRIAFLNQIDQVPGVPAPIDSYARILQSTAAICSRSSGAHPRYLKVQITTGALKGKHVWGCEGDGLYRTFIWP